MRPVVPALLAASLLGTAASPALAGGPPGSVEPTLVEPAPATRVERYGSHILLADLAWFGATVALARAESEGDTSGVGPVVTMGYYATGPIVHLAHGNRDGAVKSLATRALLPLGGALVGAMVASDASDGDCEPYADACDDDGGFAVLGGALIGFGAGAVGAMVLDWTVYSKKTVRDERPAAWAGVRPGVKISRTGVSVSVGGSF